MPAFDVQSSRFKPLPTENERMAPLKIINVMASSLDGRIGVHDREGDTERQAVGLSGEADQRFLRLQIEGADAIIVGATSIRANGECLDHPGRKGRPPVWFVYARQSFPASYVFWQQHHIPRVIVSERPLELPPGTGVINLVYGAEDPASFMVRYLEAQGFQEALLFGGGIVNRWFYDQGLVHELRLTLAPVLLGRSHAPYLVAPELQNAVKFSLLASQVEESFVFLKYQVCAP
jgi:riboflavin biosynthesis pyrimidine reductase